MLTNFGASRFNGGLNLVANLLGKPGKMEVQGHMVQDLWNEVKLTEINEYCRCDVLDISGKDGSGNDGAIGEWTALPELPRAQMATALLGDREREFAVVPVAHRLPLPRLLGDGGWSSRLKTSTSSWAISSMRSIVPARWW